VFSDYEKLMFTFLLTVSTASVLAGLMIYYGQ
jgi:hypothetical protein